MTNPRQFPDPSTQKNTICTATETTRRKTTTLKHTTRTITEDKQPKVWECTKHTMRKINEPNLAHPWTHRHHREAHVRTESIGDRSKRDNTNRSEFSEQKHVGDTHHEPQTEANWTSSSLITREKQTAKILQSAARWHHRNRLIPLGSTVSFTITESTSWHRSRAHLERTSTIPNAIAIEERSALTTTIEAQKTRNKLKLDRRVNGSPLTAQRGAPAGGEDLRSEGRRGGGARVGREF